MTEYYIVEKIPEFATLVDRVKFAAAYNWNVAQCFRPVSTYEAVRGQLMKLLGMSEGQDRSVVIYCNSCPYARIEIRNGRIHKETDVSDQRKDREKEADLYYETRKRFKNQRTGRVAGDVSQWLKASGTFDSEAQDYTPVSTENFVPMKKRARGTIFAERR